MNTYRYPENLAAKAILWLWYLGDIGIIGVGAIISVLLLTQTGFFFPIIMVAIYAFLSIRVDDTSILDFIVYACSFFIFKQQYFEGYDRSERYDKNRGKELWMIKKRKQTSRQLLNLSTITEFGLQGYNEYEMIYYFVQPTNLSVLSEETITAKIFALTNVLKGLAEVEIMCLNSKDNFDQNKLFLKGKYEEEKNETVKMLLANDLIHLDNIQIQTATARLFMIIIRIRSEEQKEKYTLLGRIDKLLKMQNFSVHRANAEEIKSMLAVYFEQNVTSDRFEDIDGERWLTNVQ